LGKNKGSFACRSDIIDTNFELSQEDIFFETLVPIEACT
jgi:hypothetical protein